MSLPVRWTPEATSDAIEIWEYIATDNPRAADRMVDRFGEVLSRLGETPYRGRAYPQLGTGVRGLPVGRYIVFYRLVDNGIQVLRVPHSARDIVALFHTESKSE